MSYILQIETATPACSVAVAQNGITLAVREISGRNLHAAMLTGFIEEVLGLCNVSYTDLDAIAVSSGPGSYTGLRIGVSTAKGLCFALEKPMIAVETLEAMALGSLNKNESGNYTGSILCPMIDARRMEVYTALFSSWGTRLTETSAEIISAESFAGLLAEQKIFFFGDGAAKCIDTLSYTPNAVFVSGFENSAAFMSKIAFEKFSGSNFENVAYFEPFYLKDFIAGKKNI